MCATFQMAHCMWPWFLILFLWGSYWGITESKLFHSQFIMGCYYGSQTVSKLFSLIIIQKCKAGDVLATAVSLLSCWNPWGATNRCFIIWLFFFFRRQEQMHWNSGERQKEIQRAENQVSSQSNILTYDLGGQNVGLGEAYVIIADYTDTVTM